MRKKILFLILSVTAVFSLTGCSNRKDKVAEATTTQEIASSQKSNDTDDADDTDDNKTTISSSRAKETDDDLASYEDKINKITKKVNNAKTSSDSSTNHDRFYALKNQIDSLENDLDSLEDTFEDSYEAGNMDLDEYKKKERSIEQLENKLDLAEDALENKFGIDD